MSAHDDVVRWWRAGAIPDDRVREALAVTGAALTPRAWRTFIERTLLSLAVVALAASLGFFVAANWQALGRFGKLALIEVAYATAIGIALWRGVDSAWGRGALIAAALATGTLLAFVGQTYQTGADTFELFAAWAVALLPIAAVARQPVLWLLWVAIVDVAAWLWTATLPGLWGIAFNDRTGPWLILGVHAVAVTALVVASARRLSWLDEPWVWRPVLAVAIAVVTLLAIDAIVSDRRAALSWPPLAAWLATAAAVYYLCRVRRTDIAVLACLSLGAIAVAVAAFVRADIVDNAVGLLFVGLAIVAMAGGAARWLRSVAQDART